MLGSGPASSQTPPAPTGNAVTTLPEINVVSPRRAQLPRRPKTRVIGPDDDPDFLWRLNHGDNNKPR